MPGVLEVFEASCTRVAAGDLTPEELARVEKMRPLFKAALEGKSWAELLAMKAQTVAVEPMYPNTEEASQ